MKKHFLSITLLLAPATVFAMDIDGEQGVVQELIAAAPRRPKTNKQPAAQVVQQDEEVQEEQFEDAQEEAPVQQLVKAKKKKQAAQAAEVQEANGVAGEEVATIAPSSAVTAATQAAAPAEEPKDDRVEAAYRRGFLGSVALTVAGYDRTAYVQSYFRCNERCKVPCNHKITIPAGMIDQLTSDRNRAIMTEQTDAIKALQAKRDGSIPSQHDIQKSIHDGPVQKLGTLVKGSNQTDNFKLNDVRPVKRVDQLLRNEDAADLQFLADAYNMVQTRMQERKAIRKNLHAQKPAESDIVYSDTEYGDDEQFVAKLQGYRKAKKAAEKAAEKK
jgi:hypothetical protein